MPKTICFLCQDKGESKGFSLWRDLPLCPRCYDATVPVDFYGNRRNWRVPTEVMLEYALDLVVGQLIGLPEGSRRVGLALDLGLVPGEPIPETTVLQERFLTGQRERREQVVARVREMDRQARIQEDLVRQERMRQVDASLGL